MIMNPKIFSLVMKSMVNIMIKLLFKFHLSFLDFHFSVFDKKSVQSNLITAKNMKITLCVAVQNFKEYNLTKKYFILYSFKKSFNI